MQVPFGTAVSARSLAGDLKVTKVSGEVQLESANGTVEAIGTPRLARVKTLSGDILIADAGSTEGIAASTVSGRLVVKGVKTRSLELATISGDLVLVNIACDRAQVRTVSGATGVWRAAGEERPLRVHQPRRRRAADAGRHAGL